MLTAVAELGVLFSGRPGWRRPQPPTPDGFTLWTCNFGGRLASAGSRVQGGQSGVEEAVSSGTLAPHPLQGLGSFNPRSDEARWGLEPTSDRETRTGRSGLRGGGLEGNGLGDTVGSLGAQKRCDGDKAVVLAVGETRQPEGPGHCAGGPPAPGPERCVCGTLRRGASGQPEAPVRRTVARQRRERAEMGLVSRSAAAAGLGGGGLGAPPA